MKVLHSCSSLYCVGLLKSSLMHHCGGLFEYSICLYHVQLCITVVAPLNICLSPVQLCITVVAPFNILPPFQLCITVVAPLNILPPFQLCITVGAPLNFLPPFHLGITVVAPRISSSLSSYASLWWPLEYPPPFPVIH